MNPSPNRLAVGTRVTVTQQVQKRRWTTEVTGRVLAFEQRKTGSWYAHGKDDKLWLDRLVLEKDDGEIVTVNLDRYSHLEHAKTGEELGAHAEPAVGSPDRKVHPGRADEAIGDRSNPAPSFEAPVPAGATVPEAQAAPEEGAASSGADAPARGGAA
ncbi:hypothetical protein [Phycisphaera mikurensis]|uniref:Uncharacterized protein n=1 Tax=Phycisphaera mikurensis (strain NBRC 102666 / KCTC 22515 / FYK2301M01) TaxID=1142394 RepID=I0IFG7_PHYMF|nr:hypothetical protein [Phycisphaera mikurensis]MBB6440603.1 hypothetical protein [Phycisphaera mikurensis]BAM04005.1 hypothetical protein PSMK_18460 [Phycisphaera mikurensis NBRC 102666]